MAAIFLIENSETKTQGMLLSKVRHASQCYKWSFGLGLVSIINKLLCMAVKRDWGSAEE